jgi:hypothetical protein
MDEVISFQEQPEKHMACIDYTRGQEQIDY